jgi:hypothetical protein
MFRSLSALCFPFQEKRVYSFKRSFRGRVCPAWQGFSTNCISKIVRNCESGHSHRSANIFYTRKIECHNEVIVSCFLKSSPSTNDNPSDSWSLRESLIEYSLTMSNQRNSHMLLETNPEFSKIFTTKIWRFCPSRDNDWFIGIMDFINITQITLLQKRLSEAVILRRSKIHLPTNSLVHFYIPSRFVRYDQITSQELCEEDSPPGVISDMWMW